MAIAKRGAALIAAVALVLVGTGPLWAQATPPRLTMQGPAEKTKDAIPRNALGKPCLDVEAASRPRLVDPTMLDHVVSLKNTCPRLIKVKVCYVNSTRCNEEDVQAYKRVDTILGSMKGVSFFRYTLTQK